MNEAVRSEDEVSPGRAAEMLGIAVVLVYQRMDSGQLPYRHAGERRLIRATDVAELKTEDRRKSFAADPSADTEELEGPTYRILREFAEMDEIDVQVEPRL